MAVAVAALIGQPLAKVAPPYNMSMVFLMAVLFSAVNFGASPAIYASAVSFLAYNFLYTEPYYTFAVRNWYDVLTLAMFLMVAVITSTFAGRVRDQATTAAHRVKATRRLYEFTRKLSAQATAGRRRRGGGHGNLREPQAAFTGAARQPGRTGAAGLLAAGGPDRHREHVCRPLDLQP